MSDKTVPCFYSLEVTGAAATLNFLLRSSNHNIESIVIYSNDFSNDVAATTAVQAVVGMFSEGLSGSLEQNFNPEFFPTLPAITPTTEMLIDEEAAAEALAEAMKEHSEGRYVGVAMTRRFDEWGDFVVVRSQMIGEQFTIKAKVAMHPQQYLLQKNLQQQELIAHTYGYNFSNHCPSVH